jgi:hypothetical protein
LGCAGGHTQFGGRNPPAQMAVTLTRSSERYPRTRWNGLKSRLEKQSFLEGANRNAQGARTRGSERSDAPASPRRCRPHRQYQGAAAGGADARSSPGVKLDWSGLETPAAFALAMPSSWRSRRRLVSELGQDRLDRNPMTSLYQAAWGGLPDIAKAVLHTGCQIP